MIALLGIHNVQPTRESRVRHIELPHGRQAHSPMARQQELPTCGGHILTFKLHADRAVGRVAPRLSKSRPFFQGQTQI